MQIRPRAAAIILNDKDELLLLRQKNPETGFEWWTLPGGGIEPGEDVLETIRREVKEECCVVCRPFQLIYVSEYIDADIKTHHLGMFFLSEIEDVSPISVGYDPEVHVQFIQECRFVAEEEIKHSKLPIFPPVFKEQFWKDLKNAFKDYSVYQKA